MVQNFSIQLSEKTAESINILNKAIRFKDDQNLLDEDRHYVLDLTGDDPVREGCFTTNVSGTNFECFLKRSEGSYLYVILGGGRWRGNGELAPVPSFPKWNYYKVVPGSLLCIEDPMYSKYPELVNGWFYGDMDTNYRQLTAELISKIAIKIGIESKNIILYSALANTSASIDVASYIKGCTIVAINATLNLTLSKEYYGFKKIVGIDIREEDSLGRNILYDTVLESKDTTFIFACNVVSKSDYEDQIMPLFNMTKSSPIYGLNMLQKNVYVWVYEAPAVSKDPHNSAESRILFPQIDFIARHISDLPLPIASDYCLAMNSNWQDHFQQRKIIASLKS